MARHVAKLAIVFEGDSPPSEFRVFAAGVVDTVKGQFLFDEQAAASVLAEYQAHGIDLMIDYDHASLDVGVDPALSGKAAGWFNLEVRNGELWAVNVRWTPPAAEALRRKEWRFMSPAFTTDNEGRVTSLLNVAITNLPATRKLQPLMAASSRSPMGEKVAAALDALEAGDLEALKEILKGMIADAAAGEEEQPAEAAPEMPAEEMAAPEEPAAPATVEETAMVEGEEDEEEKAAIKAATQRLARLTGKAALVSALDEVEVWRASHLARLENEAKLAKEREALELSQRKELVRKLIELGAETPHTSGLAKGKLCKRLVDEPLADLKDRVAALSASRGGKIAPPKPPPGAVVDGEKLFKTPHGDVTLSARELKFCADEKADPQVYATNKAYQLKAQASR